MIVTARRPLYIAVILCSVSFPLFCGCRGSDDSPKAPAKGANVLFVLVDALRSDHLECYGYGRKTAPFIARMAEEGVVFEDFTAPCSWTKPSVASLFTSLYPSQHGVLVGNCRDTADHFVSDVLPSSLPTLAETFQKADYATFAAIRNSHLKAFMGFSKGFEAFHEIRGNGSKIVIRFKNWMTKREGDQRPFFAYLHFLDVHSYNPPEKYKELFGNPELTHLEKGADSFLKFREDVKAGRTECPEEEKTGLKILYDGEIRCLDDLIKNLTEFLEEKGLWENTLFVLTADHGEEFFEHGEFAHGHSMADNLLRIPLVLRFPDAAFAGTRMRLPADLLDLPPTLMDLCGVDYPKEDWSGSSMARYIIQEKASDRDRFRYGELYRENQFEGYYLTQSLRSRDFHFLRTYRLKRDAAEELAKQKRKAGKKSLFDANLRLNHAGSYETEDKLYDLNKDPGEYTNAIQDHPEIASKMRAMLDKIDGLIRRSRIADGGKVVLDPETIEDLKRTGYIR